MIPRICHCLALVGLFLGMDLAAADKRPVRLAIVGLSHDHARGFVPAAKSSRHVELVAIVEKNADLARRYAAQYELPANLFHSDLEAMLDAVRPEAVAVCTSTFDHLPVVEACAPRGVHVMMEKPLAVNMKHARAMEAAAKKGGIHLLVNFETTWYPANRAAWSLAHDEKEIGELRRIVVRDGHQGPREIGCSEEFLAWLTDPILNGGGALTDFGCYGANLITWLMQGQRPESVFATTQQIKPDLYPKVDDEATIVLAYPRAVGIIQASWNWPYNRKDMDLYGQTGYILAPGPERLRTRKGSNPEVSANVKPLIEPHNDPLAYLAGVARGEFEPEGPSSLEINLIATEILDAARESARIGERVSLGR
jgi:predicted dehydrogenase